MNTIEIAIKVTPETAVKVINLIANENEGNTQSIQATMPTLTPQPAAPVVQPVQQAAPVQQFTAPVQVAAPAAQTVQAAPTAAPAYTIAQLQAACAPLADAGKLPELQQLISTFGVNSLSELPPARYGEFANGLRSMGGVL